MAGSVETLTLDQLGAWLSSLPQRIDLTPALQNVAVYLVGKTRDNFQGAHAPDGTPWAPLSPKTRQRKRDKRGRKAGGTPKPLQDTGILIGSLTGRGRGHYEEVTPTRLEWGTNVDYADCIDRLADVMELAESFAGPVPEHLRLRAVASQDRLAAIGEQMQLVGAGRAN